MKPSERIKDIAGGYVENYPEAIMFFLDEQAELLETHTVKEECCGSCSMGSPCANYECPCHQTGRKMVLLSKEEPTTTEKKCCDESCDDCRKDGFHSLDCPTRNQEKLPTYSYKVTCVRCEKSIKHSCGRV